VSVLLNISCSGSQKVHVFGPRHVAPVTSPEAKILVKNVHSVTIYNQRSEAYFHDFSRLADLQAHSAPLGLKKELYWHEKTYVYIAKASVTNKIKTVENGEHIYIGRGKALWETELCCIVTFYICTGYKAFGTNNSIIFSQNAFKSSSSVSVTSRHTFPLLISPPPWPLSMPNVAHTLLGCKTTTSTPHFSHGPLLAPP